MSDRRQRSRIAAKKDRIAAAAMVGNSSASFGDMRIGKAIERAMSQAVKDCYAKGIIDPDQQRAAMLAAREDVKVKLGLAPVPKKGRR